MQHIPSGPVASAYLANRSRRAMIVGPFGSGKTHEALMKLYLMGMEQIPTDGVAASRFIVSRLTRPQLVSTTIKTFHEVFPEKQGFAPVESAALRTHWRFKPAGFDHVVDIDWQFLALETDEDVARVLGLEATSIFIDEARLIDPSLLGKLTGRLRFPKVSRHRSIEMATNPWSLDHPFHELFVLNRNADTAFFHQPGGLGVDERGNYIGENLQNINQTPESLLLPWNHLTRLELGLEYYKAQVADMSPEDARLNVHSKWGVSREGKPVYSDYDDSTHCVPLKYDHALPIELGTDFGLNSATVLYQQTMNGNVRVLAEFVTEDQGTVAHHEKLKTFVDRTFPNCRIGRATGDPAGNQRGADGQPIFELVRKFFPSYQPARSNELVTRHEAVNALFRRTLGGSPALLIDNKLCPMLRQACIDKYFYKTLKGTGAQHSEQPEKNRFSHIAESLGYAVLGAGGGRPSALAGEALGNKTDDAFAAACLARNTREYGGPKWHVLGPDV